MSIKLLIADDHEVVRSGLKSLVAGTDIKVIAEAATGEAAVRLALKHEPDVVLLDIRMPEGDGLNALGRIKLERPSMPVLILSTYDNPTYVASCGSRGKWLFAQRHQPRKAAGGDSHGGPGSKRLDA